MAFISPEFLIPSKFGFEGSVSTLEADIYTFVLVVFQARGQDRGCQPFVYITEVLTGETLVRSVKQTKLGHCMV